MARCLDERSGCGVANVERPADHLTPARVHRDVAAERKVVRSAAERSEAVARFGKSEHDVATRGNRVEPLQVVAAERGEVLRRHRAVQVHEWQRRRDCAALQEPAGQRFRARLVGRRLQPSDAEHLAPRSDRRSVGDQRNLDALAGEALGHVRWRHLRHRKRWVGRDVDAERRHRDPWESQDDSFVDAQRRHSGERTRPQYRSGRWVPDLVRHGARRGQQLARVVGWILTLLTASRADGACLQLGEPLLASERRPNASASFMPAIHHTARRGGDLVRRPQGGVAAR